MHGYVLTDAAETDLRGIIRYTSTRSGARRRFADTSQTLNGALPVSHRGRHFQ